MNRFALWLLSLLVIITLVEGCAETSQTPPPKFGVRAEHFKEGLPATAALSAGKAAPVIKDPVQITPATAVGYKTLPTSVTQIYDLVPRDLSAYDVVTGLLTNNHQVKIQGYNLRIAEYQVPVAKGIYDLVLGATGEYQRVEQQTSTAGFGSLGVNSSRSLSGSFSLQQLLPTGATVSLAYTAARVMTLINNITPATQGGQFALQFQKENIRTYSNVATLGINQPLLQGFGKEITNAQIRIAQLEQQGAAADFQTNVETLIVNALQTYWELIGALESYKVQVISYAAARDLLRVNQAKFNAGMVAKTEVLQAEAAAEARREQLIQARQAVRDVEDQLKRLIFLRQGMPLWNSEIRPTQPIAWREMDVNLDETIQVALAERSEMRRARSNMQQTEVGRKVAKNQLLPQLNGFAQVQPNGLNDTFGRSFDTMSDAEFVSYDAGLQFSYPLQNRTARYKYKQAQARVEQTSESLADTRDQITLDVRQAVRDLRTAHERIEVTQSQIRSAQATLDAETKRLNVGISTSFQVLQFQQDVATAQNQHIRAVVDYNRAGIRLERARGTLLTGYGVVVEGANLNPTARPVVWPVGLN